MAKKQKILNKDFCTRMTQSDFDMIKKASKNSKSISSFMVGASVKEAKRVIKLNK